jgi:peptidoglycan/LPS O-acetylase OafA/YrhL
MSVARENLDALTGLRFVAAFTIVLGHMYSPWLEITGIGMPLFFTLSGFIIHHVYADTFYSGAHGAVREFAVARFSRIYPLYLVLLIYWLHGTMREPLLTASGFPVLLAYFTGTWTWWPYLIEGHTLLDWTYHISWSVSTEVFFYFVYAFALYRIAGLQSVSRCFAILVVFCVAVYAMFYVVYLTRDGWEGLILQHFPQFVPRTTDFTTSFYRWLLYMSPYARIFEFIGGVLTCQLFHVVRRQPGFAERLNGGAMAWAAIAIMAILFALFRYYGEYNPWLATGNHSLPGFLVNLHMNFLFAPACYLLIFSLALGKSAVSRIMASKPCRFLGDVSYSTYLSHPLADHVLLFTGLVFTATIPHLLAVFVAVYVMSWILYSLVEVPAKWSLRRIFGARRLIRPAIAETG